ncbi:MAG: 2-succinyl-5-enolpyruvyl-6-hydroxy-3-cyclohexene-1-carboxylic-acid synthase [Ilumatobacteraceae bacterium]|nr:2-succinyl-5-enolpyruvyl-6-hydroxy-3-cyclohexene-1-carboxylic-acid synthase [Ilumatobacteraceae bacterium]
MASSAAITATFCATLVDEWLACGVRHAVVSPGSRSTPMALALANRTELQVHIFHDERSAAFAALGIGKASGVPAILLCTSGTAAVEFHPAVVEAHHAEVPVLVCTADRPPELQAVGAPQTIDQQNLYGVAVRKFINADVADDGEANSWRDLAQSAFVSTVGQRRGPVHLNLQFREPLVGDATELPRRKSAHSSISRPASKVSPRQVKKLCKLLSASRGLIVAGPENYLADSVIQLAESLGWPVLADPRSKVRVEHRLVIAAADSILRDQRFAESHTPDVVLRFGTPPASKVVNTWLANSKATQVVLTTTPTLVDPDRKCALHMQCEIDAVCSELIASITARTNTTWLSSWAQAEKLAQVAINAALTNELKISEPAIARTIYASMPSNAHLVVSSSMPIRDVEWYGAPRSALTVHANRGVNGIDGVVSTAVGVALATNEPTALLIGDVALLHDTNGMLNLNLRNLDLRIFVVDNNGGGIFSFLPQKTTLDEARFEMVFGTPHQVDIEALAKAHNISAQTIESLDDLAMAVAQRGLRLTRIVTTREENVKVHDRIHQNVAAALRQADN